MVIVRILQLKSYQRKMCIYCSDNVPLNNEKFIEKEPKISKVLNTSIKIFFGLSGIPGTTRTRVSTLSLIHTHVRSQLFTYRCHTRKYTQIHAKLNWGQSQLSFVGRLMLNFKQNTWSMQCLVRDSLCDTHIIQL